MSTSGNLLTTGVGDVIFMAVNKPVTNSKTGEQHYEVSLALDSKDDAKTIAKIAKINPNIPVTAATYRGKDERVSALLAEGKTKVSARSKFAPKIYDSAGNELEEAPFFSAGATGTASMIVQPYTKSERGGTINLVGVMIHEMTGGTDTSNREANIEALKAAVEAMVKG